MVILNGLLDSLLGLTLLWIAWRTVTTTDLFQAVLSFMIFGLLMAFTWAWLQAPDVALAEATLGAVLTSVLLLDVVHEFDK